MAPRRVPLTVIRQGELNPLMRGMNDVTTQIRNRAHEGLTRFREGAPAIVRSVSGNQQPGDTGLNMRAISGLP